MGILVEVVDARCVEAAGPSLDPMHHITLLQQQLSQITAVLTCDAGNDRSLGHGSRKKRDKVTKQRIQNQNDLHHSPSGSQVKLVDQSRMDTAIGEARRF
jgi:hypothetical protein